MSVLVQPFELARFAAIETGQNCRRNIRPPYVRFREREFGQFEGFYSVSSLQPSRGPSGPLNQGVCVMSKKAVVLTFMFGALLVSGAVLNSHAASTPPAPIAPTMVTHTVADSVVSTSENGPALSCNQICHSTVDCITGTTSCGVCIIPPGSFFGHCGFKK